MAAPRKYPDELRERAVRLVLEAKKDPAMRSGACRRIGEQLGIHVPAGADHEPDHRGAAPDLSRDVDQPPALRVQPQRELLLLPAEMTMLTLHQDPPVIGFRLISQDPLHRPLESAKPKPRSREPFWPGVLTRVRTWRISGWVAMNASKVKDRNGPPCRFDYG